MTKRAITNKHPKTMTWRPNPQDKKIITAIRAKHGINGPGVLRMALRKLAEHEGLKVA